MAQSPDQFQADLAELLRRFPDMDRKTVMSQVKNAVAPAPPSRSARALALEADLVRALDNFNADISLARFKKAAAAAWNARYPDGVTKQTKTSDYHTFLKTVMPSLKESMPTSPQSERLKRAAEMWRESKTATATADTTAETVVVADTDTAASVPLPPSSPRGAADEDMAMDHPLAEFDLPFSPAELAAIVPEPEPAPQQVQDDGLRLRRSKRRANALE